MQRKLDEVMGKIATLNTKNAEALIAIKKLREEHTLQDIRWQQRFNNWQLAYSRLHEAVNANTQTPHSAIIQMALIKGFEMTFELSWKTLKDYLSYNGIDVSVPGEIARSHKNFLHSYLYTTLNAKHPPLSRTIK